MSDLGVFRSTPGGKAGAIDGLNLFFGALLGANLGTIQGMGLYDYVVLIVLLAGTVMVVRMLSTSPRRVYVATSLLLYAIIVGAFLLWRPIQPRGVAPGDLHRLAATLAVWVVFVVMTELTPVADAVPARSTRENERER